MKQIKLSKKDFKSAIAKGRGVALQFLMQSPVLDKEYSSIVEWACTTFTNLNSQDDGTNAAYYHEILCLMPNKKEIANYIVDFLQNGKEITHYKDFDNTYKAFAVLCCLANQDSQLNQIAKQIYKTFFARAERLPNGMENCYMTLTRFLFNDITGFNGEKGCGANTENFKELGGMLLDDVLSGGLFDVEDIFWCCEFDEDMRLLTTELAKTDSRFKAVVDHFNQKPPKAKKCVASEEEQREVAKSRQQRLEERKLERSEDQTQLLFDSHVADDEFLLPEIKKATSKEKIESATQYYIDSVEFTDRASLAALMALYQKTYCTNCRLTLVRMMKKYHRIPEEILEECKFDCNFQLREFVKG